MDTSLILTIIGLIATLIFGVLSIDLFKRKKNPGKLTLVKQIVIGLFNNIAKNFDEISIQYKGASIKENVIYIKSSIINDGDLDIDGGRAERTTVLKLSNDLKWIKAKITKTSPELICSPEISQDQAELKFNFGLIRKNEFFQFEALIETFEDRVKAENLFDHLTITHRIPNTQKVKTIPLLSDEEMLKKKKKMKSFVLNIGFQFFVLIALLAAQVYYFKSAPIQYISNESHVYAARATSDKKIELKNLENNDTKLISIEEFQEIGNYKPFIPDQTFSDKIDNISYLLPLLIVLLLFMVGREFLELRKSNKLYSILSETQID